MLERAGIARPPDILLVLTGDDEDNIVICQMAREKYGVPKVIARVNDPRNQEHFDLLGIVADRSARRRASSALIEHEVPEHDLIHLLELRKENLEIVEVQIDHDSPSAGKRVERLTPARGRAADLRHARRPRVDRRRLDGLQPGDQVLAILEPARKTTSAASCSAGSEAFPRGGGVLANGPQSHRFRRRWASPRFVATAVVRCARRGTGLDAVRLDAVGGRTRRRRRPASLPRTSEARGEAGAARRQRSRLVSDLPPRRPRRRRGARHVLRHDDVREDGGDRRDDRHGAVAYTPLGYTSWAGSPQITTATPVADPSRQLHLRRVAGGTIRARRRRRPRCVDRLDHTPAAAREKIAASLNFDGGRRASATTGGTSATCAAAPGPRRRDRRGEGHVADVWKLALQRRVLGRCSPPAAPRAYSAIWGRAGAVVDRDVRAPRRDGTRRATEIRTGGDAVLRLSSRRDEAPTGKHTPTNTDERTTDAVSRPTSPDDLSRRDRAGGKDGKIRLLSDAKMKALRRTRTELQVVATPSRNRLFTAPAVWCRRRGRGCCRGNGGT